VKRSYRERADIIILKETHESKDYRQIARILRKSRDKKQDLTKDQDSILRRILKGGTWLCKLYTLTKFFILGKKAINTGWPEVKKGKKGAPDHEKERKEKILKILSQKVSHCLEELKIEELFEGVRNINQIKRKMSKTHFLAVKILVGAGKEIDFFDKRI
jgi:hypothetical protein